MSWALAIVLAFILGYAIRGPFEWRDGYLAGYAAEQAIAEARQVLARYDAPRD